MTRELRAGGASPGSGGWREAARGLSFLCDSRKGVLVCLFCVFFCVGSWKEGTVSNFIIRNKSNRPKKLVSEKQCDEMTAAPGTSAQGEVSTDLNIDFPPCSEGGLRLCGQLAGPEHTYSSRSSSGTCCQGSSGARLPFQRTVNCSGL